MKFTHLFDKFVVLFTKYNLFLIRFNFHFSHSFLSKLLFFKFFYKKIINLTFHLYLNF